MNRLRKEMSERAHELTGVQTENEDLARLVAQQEALAVDARRFLAELEQRRASILDALARFVNGPLRTT